MHTLNFANNVMLKITDLNNPFEILDLVWYDKKPPIPLWDGPPDLGHLDILSFMCKDYT